MTRLVIDASAALYGLTAGGEPDLFRHSLVAPALLWSEVTSELHTARWRGQITRELAEAALERFGRLTIERDGDSNLLRGAWSVAERLGWARTYNAEYVALAERLGIALLTADARLQRGAARLVPTIGPSEL